jgi:hypothetical protein
MPSSAALDFARSTGGAIRIMAADRAIGRFEAVKRPEARK